MINYLEKNRKFAVIFMVLMAVEIFLVSSITGSKPTTGGLNLSVLYHSIVFFLFSFFTILSIVKKNNKKMKSLILPVVISFLYAVLDEVHQLFVPLRNASILDVLVDTTGILLSVAVYLYYKRTK
ncbi:MAG: VanZ family protein [Nanoarchaeota archaeon]